MKSDFGDIRFAYPDGTNIPYWLESKTDITTARVWIKVSLPLYGTTPTGDNTIYMYYGNPAAASASDGAGTFPIEFADFESGIDGYSAGTSSTTQKYSGAKSLRLTIGYATKSIAAVPAKPYVIEGWFYATQNTGSDSEWMMACNETADYACRIEIGYRSTTVFGYQDASGWHVSTATYSAGQWYFIQHILNADNTYTAYATDTSGNKQTIYANISRPSGYGTARQMRFYAAFSNVGYVDAVRIRAYVTTEPTVTTGIEERLRKGGIIMIG
jgi:hypothetical protein